MNQNTSLTFVFALTCVSLASCGPSQADLDATATQEQADKSATLTAEAPTATPEPSITPTPTLLPKDILEASISALEEYESYHFEMDIQIKLKEEGLTIDMPMTSVGDVQSQDRIHSRLSVTLMGITVESEVILIGETEYATNPETGEWEASTGVSFSLSPTAFTEIDPADLVDLTSLGQESVNGAEVYHLAGSVSSEEIGEVGGELQIDYWIGVEDFLPRMIGVEGEIEFTGDGVSLQDAAGTANIAMTMELSDFGKTVVIDVPELAPTPEVLESPFGPMAVYEGSLYPFTIQYPGAWVEQPAELGETARFVSDQGGLLVITEEDLIAEGLGELTLEEYGNLILSIVSTSTFDFELLERQSFMTQDDVSGEVLAFTFQDGVFEARRFYYVHNGGIATNATFIASNTRFDELEEMVNYSFGTFQLTR